MPAVLLLGPLGLLWGLAFPVGTACYTQSQAVAGWTIAELFGWNRAVPINSLVKALIVIASHDSTARSAGELAEFQNGKI